MSKECCDVIGDLLAISQSFSTASNFSIPEKLDAEMVLSFI
ncbi:hypothetical protein [Bacillus thuringiensis]|nr:hypothetical protein [Bacillus thuringiensis]